MTTRSRASINQFGVFDKAGQEFALSALGNGTRNTAAAAELVASSFER
jgi:hypothetical protein